MKGQYDIMEQEKQPEEKKSTNVMQKCIIAVLLIMLAITIVLCIRIGALEEKVNNFHNQMEEVKFTLDTQMNAGETKETAELQSDVNTELKEQTESSSANVENEGTQSEVSAQEEIKHKVYLTFDDGPSANTEAILDILDSYGVKATFFVLGKEDQTSIERLQMIYERGHTIGMHSYSHVYSDIYYSLDNFKADFWKSKQYLLNTIGADCLYYRFPGGSSNTAANMNMQECVEFLQEQGVEYYDWNIVSGDGSSRKLSKETIIKNCTESITNYGTSIILLHDASSKKETVEALPEIIEAILSIEGAVILPITEDTKAVHHVITQPASAEPIPEMKDETVTENEGAQVGQTETADSVEEVSDEQEDEEAEISEETEGEQPEDVVSENSIESQTGE